MTWILVLFVYVGAFSKSDSVALTNVPGFSSQADCEKAGKAAEKLVSGRFVCLPQPVPVSNNLCLSPAVVRP